MQVSNTPACPKSVRGWILDVYPSNMGEMAVWVISANGERVSDKSLVLGAGEMMVLQVGKRKFARITLT